MDLLHPAVWFWLLLLLLALIDERTVSGVRLQYSRNELLRLGCRVPAGVSDITAQFPDHILKRPDKRSGREKWREKSRRRKRGKRGGVRLRMRKLKLNRVPLPSMILGNAQSLRNKMDELQGNVRFLKDFKDCGILTFTETWLTERDRNEDLLIDGFGEPLRLDRDAEVTGKSQGGGVCLYVNQRYCHPKAVTVRERICTPDIELLCVSLRPFYLPREFPQLFITTVYLHPKANASSACSAIHDVVQKLQSASPDAPIFVLGDFNHVSLKKTLPDFYQYVTCPTRRDKTIDLCYGSVKEAYKSLPLPPLGSGDHNCVHLLPTYRTVLNREKVHTRDIKDWTEEAVLCLQECYDCTDWDMFKEACGEDLDELADVTCSYAAFCRDMIIPCRRVKVFPNNKPWITKSVKACIQTKRLTFKQGSASELHTATKEVKREILKAKQDYKRKLENKMAMNNLGSAWSSMKTIAGLQHSKTSRIISLDSFQSDTEFANALNCFYTRFDAFDFSQKIQEVSHKVSDNKNFFISLKDVEKSFCSLKPNKSSGPDNICGRLLKSCAKELSSIFQHIFNQSLKRQHVPRVWKDAVVIPAPKISFPKTLNDFRPIALTSIVMKCFEKIVRFEILKNAEHNLDPMQFAYRPNRGVEDATVTLLHLLFKHLEGKGTHARLLFIDFSSAFNTIQPHVLALRLLEHFNISNNLVGWILNFLTDRTQKVRVNGAVSDQITSSTGSPQGCVLSPLLFILYTNMCRSTREDRTILKYADDTVIVSLLKNKETGHGPVVDDFLDWCSKSFLEMNVSKTKDMIIDFRKNRAPNRDATVLKGQIVECVNKYKYLGTIIDSELNFDANCEAVYKKGRQRLSCLRKLSIFNIDRTMLILFYRAFIESVLSFCLVSWFGTVSLKSKNCLNQIVKWSSKLIGECQLHPESLYARQLQRIGNAVVKDDSHPLNGEFQLLPSGRRFMVPVCKTRRYKNSFVPAAICAMNK